MPQANQQGQEETTEPRGPNTQCALCEQPGTLAGAREVGRVSSNVRRFQDEYFTLWRCTGCGSIHCAEDVDLDHYYAHYPLQQHQCSFHDRIGYRNRLSLLQAQGFQRPGRLLDYGCGAGLFVEHLKAEGLPQVFGFDAYAQPYTDPSVLEATYEAVVAYDVLEHVDDPRELLRQLTQLVHPGGLLVIGTPNANHVAISQEAWLALHPPYHRHIFSEQALLALGREQGLEVAHIHRRSFFDSLVPTVNSRFMCSYIEKAGGFLEVVVEPQRKAMVLRSPRLLFQAFFGYFFPAGDSMLVTFRKPS